jgi:hypothetical protein
MDTLQVTVDKKHLITIGERLYAESIELIRELVNNAYDADATLVEVNVKSDRIEVRDNGTGMDLKGLQQYFTIGSDEKLTANISSRFQRERIGQFGIGKFASLSACNTFEIFTKKGDFAAKVIFDKEYWENSGDVWSLPLEHIPVSPHLEDGTTVILRNLTKSFNIKDLEERIKESVPLKAPHFKVLLNNHPVLPKSFTGHRIPILEGCSFGPITGEIVILPQSAASMDDVGIEIKVKQVTVTRELLGMEYWGKDMARVRGEIHANFLLVTSDRSGFIRDSEEYKEFQATMEKVMEEVASILGRLTTKQESRKASRALKDAMEKVCRALRQNPELSPFGGFPIADGEGLGGVGKLPEEQREQIETIAPDEKQQRRRERKARKKKPTIKRVTPHAIVKRMKFGDFGVSVCLDHFGKEGSESFAEGTVIYINRDHPLFEREMKKPASFTMHIARLLTQEISLMKDPRNPRHAFERQSRLLRDAFVDK